ncbi:MAG: N-acetyltransferase [Gammaproteobacteria bacterium]|jgi:predicted GNAT family acetyltransferase|nr:N-acetyltransferase [Gammaproteobacteria bacterium]
MTDLDIRLDLDAGRFEAVVEGHSCVLDFTREGKVVSMNHVGVPKAVGGRGIAGQLTRHALEWADEQGLEVRARCPYVARWIERHPEYQRLLT